MADKRRPSRGTRGESTPNLRTDEVLSEEVLSEEDDKNGLRSNMDISVVEADGGGDACADYRV